MNNIVLVAIIAALLYLGIVLWKRLRSPYMPPKPKTLRNDLLYGYYGRNDNQCIETAGAVNLAIEMLWDGIDATIKRIRRQPVQTILGVTSACWIDNKKPRSESEAKVILRDILDKLRSEGVIDKVIGFYPIDEPDLWGASDADVKSVCKMIRSVCKDYPDLGGTLMVCCYSKSGVFPGLSEFDWVGVDDYPEDSNMLVGAPFLDLRSSLREDQRIFLIPGGCDPFRNNPEAFRRFAHSDPKVVAIIPFLWIDYNDPQGKFQKGIRSNGMDTVYRKLGAEIVGARHG